MAAIELKSPSQLAKIRHGGRIVAEVLRLIESVAEPGTTTEQLDRAAADYIEQQGAAASFKGYRGYPATICASINEEVVHGIPGPRRLREGDLLKVDVGVLWQGYHSDAAATIAVGDVSDEARRLMQATRASLHAGIAAVRAGARVSDVSRAIEQVIVAAGFGIVTDYTGHGVGRALHEDPKVPNYTAPGLLKRDTVLQDGLALAIEPMVNVGTGDTKVLANGWTVVSRDGSLSAHYEHTVAVEEGGGVILTLP